MSFNLFRFTIYSLYYLIILFLIACNTNKTDEDTRSNDSDNLGDNDSDDDERKENEAPSDENNLPSTSSSAKSDSDLNVAKVGGGSFQTRYRLLQDERKAIAAEREDLDNYRNRMQTQMQEDKKRLEEKSSDLETPKAPLEIVEAVFGEYGCSDQQRRNSV